MADQVRVNAQEMAEDWANRMGQSASKVERGVQNVQDDPTNKAADASDAYVQGVQNAQAKFEQKLRNTSMDYWKQRTIDVGVQRIAQGARAAQDKFQSAAEQIIEHENRGLRDLPNDTNVTLADSRENMVAWFEHMSNLSVQ